MKTRLIPILIALLSFVLTVPAQSVNWDKWSWEAPDPALPDTQYVDLGWDSTSNGVPAQMAQREAAPLRLAQRKAIEPAPMPAAPAPAPAKASQSLVNGLSISPYYTVGFARFDGKATGGAGLDVGLNLSKTVQLVSFAESDDLQDNFIDRFGLGVQLTGKLGRWLKPFARLSGGYNFQGSAGLREDSLFLRPQFGGIIDIWRKGNWHASITGSWGLDVDTAGNAAQRIFGGAVLGTSF